MYKPVRKTYKSVREEMDNLLIRETIKGGDKRISLSASQINAYLRAPMLLVIIAPMLADE